MLLLLDTHIVLWALTDSPRLPKYAKDLILDAKNQIFVSVASLWEVEIKHCSHPDRMAVDGKRFCDLCGKAGFESLPIETKHVLRLSGLTRAPDAKPHNDPFDRILVCQAAEEGMRLVTHDSLVSSFDEPCILPV